MADQAALQKQSSPPEQSSSETLAGGVEPQQTLVGPTMPEAKAGEDQFAVSTTIPVGNCAVLSVEPLAPAPANVADVPSAKLTQDTQDELHSSAALAEVDGESDTEYDDPWFDAACLSAVESPTYDDVVVPAGTSAADNRSMTSASTSTKAAVAAEPQPIEMRMEADHGSELGTYQLPAELCSGGFSTAKGSALPAISAAAQVRAKRMFEEVDKGLSVGWAEEADEDALAAALQEAKKQKSNAAEAVVAAAPVSFGFATASNKALAPPSEQARQRAALLFKQAEADLAAEDSAAETPIGTKIEAPSLASARTLVETPSKPGPARHSLFTTGAGGTPVQVSEAAKKRAMALFADIDADVTASPTAQKVLPRSRTRSSEPGLVKPLPAQMQDVSNVRASSPQLGSMKPRPVSMSTAAAFATPARPRIPSGLSATHVGLQSSPAASPLARRPGMGIPQRSQATLNRRAPFVSPLKAPQMRASPVVRKGVVRMEASTPRLCFDLRARAPRQALAQAGLSPGQCSKGEPGAEHLPDEIWAVDATNALYYHFASPDGVDLDPAAALKELRKDGWTHVGQKWVEEHWVQILWKLAAEIRAAPRLFQEKWSFQEVMRQLRYRYEREVNRAQRSAIKRIQEQDSPPSMPMVLFVYAIEHKTYRDESGAEKTSITLQLSDGWYRILANADAPLTRAITRGSIRVGVKLAVSGARLDASKDGNDVLDALDKSSLSISGNSTCLAPWDARLGFSLTPHIATTASLTADGGLTPMMCIKVTRVYPLAYFDAKSRDAAPWNQGDEQRLQEQWLSKMSEERQRLVQNLERDLNALEEDVAAMRNLLDGVDTSRVVDTDDVFDQYEAAPNKSAFIRSLDASHLFNLWQAASSEAEQMRIQGTEDLERDLYRICPPRDVRSFQVIRFEDAIRKSPPSRIESAQLQIWEAKDKALKESDQGATFLVSSFMPWKPGAWYSNKETREVFLQTRRDTRWRRVS